MRRLSCFVRGCYSPAIGAWRKRGGSVVVHLCDEHAAAFKRKGRKVAEWPAAR